MSSTNKTIKLLLSQFLGTDKPTRSDYNSDMSKIDAAARTYAIFPVGHIGPCLKSTAPAQTLLLQGQLISRATYADLYAFAVTSGNIVSEAAWSASAKGSFSVGDGSTTFRLPDLRDQFLRGASGTRVLGTSQLDAIQNHFHSTSGTLAAHDMGIGWVNGTSGSGWNPASLNTSVGSPITDGTNGTPRTANETRPVNIAVNYLIVY